ncbi:hypothetical protein [Flavobacterium cheongpyeongense]|uniref:hypothetical protein n=1 Tax=Flavobacterium cheongpyeongense TaxID=2212651 RepID=UPI000F4FAD26|nr:hypothetical protein [Flavobacterium cheongpyeongense]
MNYDNQEPPQTIIIDIDENSSIGELLSKIHEITKIPTYSELNWDGNIEKISCRYYFKSGTEYEEYQMIRDLDQKICDFPKNGVNGELSLFIDGSVGLVN